MKSRSQPATEVRIPVREILILGLLGAILIIVQVALAIIPNVELVSLLLIVYTLVLGKKVFYPLYVFILAEGLIYGFGIWWVNYLYVWDVLVLAVLLLRKIEQPALWAVVSGIFGLLFGSLCAIAYLFMGGMGAAAAYWVNGIIFDFIHCAGNVIAALLLFKPTYKVIGSLYHKSANQVQ